MAIDKKYFMKEKSKLKRGQNTNSSIDVLELKPGENVIRIIPYKFDTNQGRQDQFVPIYWHFNIGGKAFVSPLTIGQNDPIYNEAVKKRQVAKVRQDYKIVDLLTPSVYYFTPVIRLDQSPNNKVYYWRLTENLYSKIVDLLTDDDYGDIIDPQDGMDLKVTFTPKDQATGVRYNNYEIKVRPKRTKMVDNKDTYARILEEQVDVKQHFSKLIPSEEEIKIRFNEFINGDEDDNVQNNYSSTNTKSSVEPSVETSSNPDDEFKNKLDALKQQLKTS